MRLAVRLALSLVLAVSGLAVASAPPGQAAPTITISPASLPNAVGGQPYSQTFVGSGGVAPYHLSLRSGSIPPGMALSSSGRFYGTPTKTATMPASYAFGVRLTDDQNNQVDANYTITVTTPTITISPARVPDKIIGQYFSHDLSARGGGGTYSYSLRAGSLPTGVALNSLGSLYGTPDKLGTFSFTVTASDNYGFTGDVTYSLEVQNPPPSLTSSAPLTPALLRTYRHVLAVAGGNVPYRFTLTSGSLPTGLALSPDGVISVTPTVAGGYLASISTVSSSTAPLVIPLYLAVAPKLTAKVSRARQHRGRWIRVTGAGLVPRTRVVVILDGRRRLGTTVARPNGTFALRIRVPRATRPGTHRVVVKAAGLTVRRPLRVTR